MGYKIVEKMNEKMDEKMDEKIGERRWRGNLKGREETPYSEHRDESIFVDYNLHRCRHTRVGNIFEIPGRRRRRFLRRLVKI